MTDFQKYGMSISMGPLLRQYVEKQLIQDLNYYQELKESLHFDWSDSCIEGQSAKYLDGVLENFSGISVLNEQLQIVAHGWMEFVFMDTPVIYWDLLTINSTEMKNKPGLPKHISDRLTAG
ncbi:hypothetical protein D0C36_06735 [Mucilaginibacter conchicola]|uniref:Uncharacterized protein n=1 Tax=Mucilaginibacter conchicola TaxID=2303333 RepID=A0A372NYM3_9SPHI|nr:hypothetical protein [Mucilaginibacter conchicola]RFZ95218.1 hypothetical protein D0C36_06735 [Mucilaginibacter conchicola]